jgi:hypothetical protein
MRFTAGAGGVISQDFLATTNNSHLTVDERKVIRNVRNGY